MEHQRTSAVSTCTYEICAVALLWVALFEVNNWLFSITEVSRYINWIFLPAALRVLAVLVLGGCGAAGLFAGTLLTCHPQVGVNLTEALVLASLSALAPLVAVRLATGSLNIAQDFKGLTFRQLTVISAAGALTSVLFHNIFFHFQDHSHRWLAGMLPMLAGDLVGTLLVLFASALVLRALPHIAK